MNNLNEIEFSNGLFTQYLLRAQEVGSITSTGVDNGFTGKNKKGKKYDIRNTKVAYNHECYTSRVAYRRPRTDANLVAE